MEFRPDRVEVEVGSVLELPLDIQTTLEGKKYSFNDCRNMPLNVTFTDPSVVENVDGKYLSRSLFYLLGFKSLIHSRMVTFQAFTGGERSQVPLHALFQAHAGT